MFCLMAKSYENRRSRYDNEKEFPRELFLLCVGVWEKQYLRIMIVLRDYFEIVEVLEYNI